MFFIEGSPNKDINEALREAERVRKALREEEYEKIVARAADAAKAAAKAAQSTEDGEDAPTTTVSRRVERRSAPGRRRY